MPSFWQSTALAQGLPRAGKTYHGRAYLELEPQPRGCLAQAGPEPDCVAGLLLRTPLSLATHHPLHPPTPAKKCTLPLALADHLLCLGDCGEKWGTQAA